MHVIYEAKRKIHLLTVSATAQSDQIYTNKVLSQRFVPHSADMELLTNTLASSLTVARLFNNPLSVLKSCLFRNDLYGATMHK